MTKPGNSDRDDSDEVERSQDSEAAEPEPADPEPLMTELEKAPPPPKEEVVGRTARPRREEALAAPGFLRYAFYLYILAAVVGVIGGIYLLLNKQRFIDELIKANKNPDLSNEQIASGTNTLLWLLLIVTVTFGVFFALFGYKARDGVRKARVMLTIVSIIAVLFYYVLFRTPLGLMSSLVALIATMLLYLPSATAYFRRHEVR